LRPLLWAPLAGLVILENGDELSRRAGDGRRRVASCAVNLVLEAQGAAAAAAARRGQDGEGEDDGEEAEACRKTAGLAKMEKVEKLEARKGSKRGGEELAQAEARR